VICFYKLFAVIYNLAVRYASVTTMQFRQTGWSWVDMEKIHSLNAWQIWQIVPKFQNNVVIC